MGMSENHSANSVFWQIEWSLVVTQYRLEVVREGGQKTSPPFSSSFPRKLLESGKRVTERK